MAILIPIALFPVSAFAIDPISSSATFAALADAYGMSYGVGSVYSVTSSSGVADTFDVLWDDFNSYRSDHNQSTYNLDTWLDRVKHESDPKPFVSSFTHSSGKFSGFYVDAESARMLDEFWNWLLTGPAEISIVDNQWAWDRENDVVISPVVSSYSLFPGVPSLSGYGQSIIQSEGFLFASSGSARYFAGIYPNSSSQSIFLCGVLSNGSYIPFAFSDYQYSIIAWCRSDLNNNWQVSLTSFQSDIYYASLNAQLSASFYSSSVPLFSSLSEALDTFADRDNLGSSISLVPYGDEPNPQLPIVSLPDYVPQARELVTDIPWDDDEYGDVFPLPDASLVSVISTMVDAISANDFALLDDPNPVDPDAPPPPASEIFSPLLPVSPPSFNFNFAGIWHYVVTWVQSLGSWLSTMFAVWAALPYAMVVPVYATAVVVIVLGVYKRFFM